MKFNLRKLVIAGAMAFTALVGTHAQAEYPSQPIKMIVPFPAGGGTDNMARLLSAGLSEMKGWSVVIDNKPGAGGNLALAQVARSTPDGLTVIMAQTDNVVLNPLLYSNLTYDPDTDLRSVALVAAGPAVLVVEASSPYQSLNDIVEAAKKDPGKLTFASPGTGTVAHLISESWQKNADIQFTHIPFRGMAQAMPDLLSGRVDMYMGSIPTLLSHIQSGKVRAIAVTTSARSSLLPDVPTYAESGIKGVDLASVWGVMVPATTPDAVVNTLNAAINEVIQSPEYSKKIQGYGAELLSGTPQDMADLYARDRAALKPIVESSGTSLN